MSDSFNAPVVRGDDPRWFEKSCRPKNQNYNRQTDLEVDLQRLVQLLLDEPWHAQCKIIPDYMPPYAKPDTRPKVVVRHNNETKYPSFLRYNSGQGFFWDIYGDDMQEVELAIIALSQAPFPESVAPMAHTHTIGDFKSY